MLQVQVTTNPTESTPKKVFGMRLFRSKPSTNTDRKGSLDSNVIAKHAEDSYEQPKERQSSLGKLLRRKHNSIDLPRAPTSATSTRTSVSSLNSAPGSKLRKQSKSNFPAVDVSQSYQRDKQTGEAVVDHTDLLHSLVHQESSDTIPRLKQFKYASPTIAQTGEQFLSRLPTKVWLSIFELLSPADKASLSFTSKILRHHLFSAEEELGRPENAGERTDFLLRLDSSLPNHLLCFACNTYHLRLNPRKESLKPTNVANPLFTCPHAQNLDKRVSRLRLTSNRTLPFTFVQLTLRAHHFSTEHGISLDSLSKRWRDRENQWNHISRYAIVDGHLLMRIISTSFAASGLPPAGLRNLLYNPHEEFHPYFSTCPHWRDGDLMPTVKCALSHIPKPIEGGGFDRVGKELKARYARQNPIVSLCSNCRPMRRCPECPTEYLIEIKLAEDRSEADPTQTFKQALVITRWSDLGDGSSPAGSREWAAGTGDLEGFDSFGVLGKRAISGVFESLFTVDQIPPQRMLNMNPNKEKLGENGHNWY